MTRLTLAFRYVAPIRLQDIEILLHLPRNFGGRQEREPTGRQHNGERYALRQLADVHNSGLISRRQLEARLHSERAVHKQVHTAGSEHIRAGILGGQIHPTEREQTLR